MINLSLRYSVNFNNSVYLNRNTEQSIATESWSFNLILQALQATNGNVEAAIELLFNDME